MSSLRTAGLRVITKIAENGAYAQALIDTRRVNQPSVALVSVSCAFLAHREPNLIDLLAEPTAKRGARIRLARQRVTKLARVGQAMRAYDGNPGGVPDRRNTKKPKSTYFLIVFVDRDSKEQRNETRNTQHEAIERGRALLRAGHTDIRFRGDQQTDWIRVRRLDSRTTKNGRKPYSHKQYPFYRQSKKKTRAKAHDPFRRDPRTGLLPGSPKGLVLSCLPEGRKKTKNQRGGDAMEKRFPGSFESG